MSRDRRNGVRCWVTVLLLRVVIGVKALHLSFLDEIVYAKFVRVKWPGCRRVSSRSVIIINHLSESHCLTSRRVGQKSSWSCRSPPRREFAFWSWRRAYRAKIEIVRTRISRYRRPFLGFNERRFSPGEIWHASRRTAHRRPVVDRDASYRAARTVPGGIRNEVFGDRRQVHVARRWTTRATASSPRARRPRANIKQTTGRA